jgi:hypothetical protein
MHECGQVSQLANYLKSVGVGRGSDVTIYMPMIPELPAAMARAFPTLPPCQFGSTHGAPSLHGLKR